MALLAQSFRAILPQMNNQLRAPSNTRNQATIQDGNGGHRIELGMPMQVKENWSSVITLMGLDILQGTAGEQGNTFDADVDNQPVQDLALNEDNIFQADECDAFDSNVDDEPTTQTIFMANLSLAGLANPQAIHQSYLSNVIPYDQYLSVNNISVVPSCASSTLNNVCISSDNDAFVPHDPIANELNIYKEQVAIYEQRAKQAKKDQPTLYDGDELLKPHHVSVIVPSSEEELELAEATRNKLHNGVVERRNRTLVEAARTMLIFSKAVLFLALCYPTNDSEDLGKLKAKADIGFFVGYAPNRKGYRIYNKRTRQILETIHVTFDELTGQTDPVHSSSGPAPNLLTPRPISLGLVPNSAPAIPYVPPTNNDLELLFQPMFDEYFETPTGDHQMPPVPAAPTPAILTGPSVSISFDRDAPSGIHSPSSSAHQSSSVHHGIATEHSFEVNPFTATEHEPFVNVFAPDLNSEASTSGVITITAPNQSTQPHEHLRKWTDSHLFDNIIGNPSRPVSTRKQLATVPPPDCAMIIALKWIYKVKLDEYGDVLKNKPRLVAKGYLLSMKKIDFEDPSATDAKN
ncbi:retrovirus-related pol polyprotein from transposon TNT 1-94 [Tanacetum coccineum]|uniref:Retrovirus-related pol polyprotein from transposon TNT 1-94 n=1 Tax=Tanacetum coccineum TaxID=301880 RepID=A0ABQ5IYN3_9ASTR